MEELLAKDKVGTARSRLKEVRSKPASPRTETPYKAQPEDEQAQHARSLSVQLRGFRQRRIRLRRKMAGLCGGSLCTLSGEACAATSGTDNPAGRPVG
jgi:hypothetical protein